MKIASTEIAIPANYVLIKPDSPEEEFHSKGKATFKTGKVDLEHVGSHYSIRGQVFGIPEKLTYNLPSILVQRIQQPVTLTVDQTAFYFRSNLAEITHQKNTSVLCDVDIEVATGDIVFFNYLEHYNCYAEGRWVMTTDEGELLLMRYDQLICCHADTRGSKLTMLNGFVLVEPITIESLFGTNVYKKAGLWISSRKQDIEIMKRKTNLGFIRFSGKPSRSYIELPEHKDGDREMKEGEIVLYNPRITPALEYGLHKHHFGGLRLVKMKRRDIFCIFPEEFNTDLKNLPNDYKMN